MAANCQVARLNVTVFLLAGVTKLTRPAALAPQQHAKGRVPLRQRHVPVAVRQLPHAAQPVVQVPGPCSAFLSQEVMAVQVGSTAPARRLDQNVSQAPFDWALRPGAAGPRAQGRQQGKDVRRRHAVDHRMRTVADSVARPEFTEG